MALKTRQSKDCADAYSAAIDLSNSCREFYFNRQRTAETFKEKIRMESMDVSSNNPKSFMDEAMATLRKEMATLMDQDLGLMKQLLTMNDTIEEIKFRRYHGGSKNLSTIMYDSESDLLSLPSMSSLPSMASIPSMSSLVSSSSSLPSVVDDDYQCFTEDDECDDDCQCSITEEETAEGRIVLNDWKIFNSQRSGSVDSGFGDNSSSSDSESEC